MASLDAKFSGEIFRKDHPMILAQNRQLASLGPVRLAYSSSDYAAGTVLGRNSTSGLYEAYSDSGASGTDTAVCILFEDVPSAAFASTGDSQLARAIMGGEVYEAKLTGLDANAKTDLKARSIIDATGITVLKF